MVAIAVNRVHREREEGREEGGGRLENRGCEREEEDKERVLLSFRSDRVSEPGK